MKARCPSPRSPPMNSVDPGTLRFRIGDATLKPFHETYDRHSVYLDVKLK